MKELFDTLQRNKHVDYLIDTCFFYFAFDRHEKDFIHFCDTHDVGMTSFNVEEVLHHAHHVNHHIRERIRKAIKHNMNLTIIDCPVHPGNPDAEKEYVAKTDEYLLTAVPDPSDAVMAAVAVKIHASILTRDKHHVFTTVLENYFQEQGISVYNNFPR